MNSIRLKEIGRKIFRPYIAALLLLLAACDMPDVKPVINSLIILMNQPVSGKKHCLWVMDDWE